MSTLTSGRGSSISQHLHAMKKILQNMVYDARTSVAPDKAELDVLEQDTLEIHRLIRSWRNAAAPINRIPPEILSLLPDFWGPRYGDWNVIALTHVCQAWRQVFTSRPSFWADLDCDDPADKILVYLKRSKSFPIKLLLYRDEDLPPHDAFFQITPQAIGRLKSLSVRGTLENLQSISHQLLHPAPILDDMSITGSCDFAPEDIPVLTPMLFGGDLSSLRKLRLEYVRTELPWRNMVTLTSLRLIDTSPVSTGQLLDFLESAPHLQEVELRFTTPTSGAQNGRLVSLAHLKKMSINGDRSSVLLNHLLIPVGAHLTFELGFPNPSIEDPPRFLDNLRNLNDFTKIRLTAGQSPYMQFNGPNGKVTMSPMTSPEDGSRLVLGCLSILDTSKTEQLKIDFDNSASNYPPRQTLLRMKDLRTLKLYQSVNPGAFIRALDPSKSSAGLAICPKLEELVIEHEGTLSTEDLIGMAAARESSGAKLKSVRIVTQWPGTACPRAGVLELEKHVLRVRCGRRFADDSCDSD